MGKETVDTGHSRHMFYVARNAVVGHCSNKKAALLSAAQTVHDGKDAQTVGTAVLYILIPGNLAPIIFFLSHKRLNCKGRNVTSVFSPFPFNRIVFFENEAWIINCQTHKITNHRLSSYSGSQVKTDSDEEKPKLGLVLAPRQCRAVMWDQVKQGAQHFGAP